MVDINIKTTLGINPRQKPHELIAITRGASFIFNYELPVSYSLLEQLTFTFKQKSQIYWFKMFKYFIPTEDTEIEDSKVYYLKQDNEFTVVNVPLDNPHDAGYYEAIWEPEEGENNLDYVITNNFSYNRDTNIITFILSSAETARFYPTCRGAEVAFEITIRTNTDTDENFINHDSVIVYPQPALIVKDSLYGQFSADTNTVSNSPERLASTGRSVRE